MRRFADLEMPLAELTLCAIFGLSLIRSSVRNLAHRDADGWAVRNIVSGHMIPVRMPT